MSEFEDGDTAQASLTRSIHNSLKPSLGGALGRLHRLWRRAICEAVAPLGMTESRWSVMVHLAKVGEGCSQQVLARELAIEMPSLTRTLNQLEQQALIERRPDPADRRAHSLWFTDAGRRMTARLEQRIQSVRNAICEDLDETQLDAFVAAVHRMEANVIKHLEQTQENTQP